MIKDFVAVFLTVFVSMSIFNVVPIYSLNANNKLLKEITITTFIVGIVFILIGNYIFIIMGINIGQFEIAGGIVLFLISAKNVIVTKINSEETKDKIGVIPIAIPLILGPGAITALATLKDVYPLYMIIIVFVVNIIINHIILYYSKKVYKVFKNNGILIMEKIMSLMFASYGIMLIEKGIKAFLN